MTKNKFLKELDKNLHVLAEEERKDILNEYRDIIEEKVKHGKSEEEAVLEFGSIEELSREILSAYKLDPDYNQKEDTKKKENFDGFVKKSAKKAAEFSKEVVENVRDTNQGITVEFAFELLFKSLAALIVMFLSSIPFSIVKDIGKGVLKMAVYPIDQITISLWSVLIFILYATCCFLIFIAMFKQYFHKTENVDEKKKEEGKKVEKVTMKENEKKKETKTKIARQSEDSRNFENGLLSIFNIGIKILLLLFIWFPLVFFNFGILFAFVLLIYLFIKGIALPGIMLILLGVIVFFGYLQYSISTIVFHYNKKVRFYPYVIGIVIGLVGSIVCFDHVMNMNYYNSLPQNNFKMTTYEKKFTVSSDIDSIQLEMYTMFDNVKYVIDDELKDDEVLFQIKYRKDFYDDIRVHLTEYTNYDDYETKTNEEKIANFMYISDKTNMLSPKIKVVRNMVIENFKKGNIYNYELFYCRDIIIKTNTKTKAKITNINDMSY